MPDLSILIPARNEIFLADTVQDILKNKRGSTEIIVVLDGTPAELPEHPDVRVIYKEESIGQRAATNEAARLSNARFVMKCDAHVAFDEGFDIKLIEPYRNDELNYKTTSIARMYNLHVFDWECECGKRTYQGPMPVKCECGRTEGFKKTMVWKPRLSRMTDFARFDNELHFQYWGNYKNRPEAKSDLADVMCFVGACWLMPRERYWELDGCDEAHGSWGQQGVEMACKSWLSGGRVVVNKRTWFAHLFRTQPGFGFPYPMSGSDQERARTYSQWMWRLENPDELPHWDKAVRPLRWMLDKFAPVPGWENLGKTGSSKGIIYYTDNRLDEHITRLVQKQLYLTKLPIVSSSLRPIQFGENHPLQMERGPLTLFRQILEALEHSASDIVFFCEHDVLYHPSHFEFVPPKEDVFYYNVNVWKLRLSDGHAVKVDFCQQQSGLCCYRKLAIQHFRKKIDRVEREGKFDRNIGFEPGTHQFPRGIDEHRAESWSSPCPNLDIRHEFNMTSSRWSPDQFRNPKFVKGWTETDDEIPGWGKVQAIVARIREA